MKPPILLFAIGIATGCKPPCDDAITPAERDQIAAEIVTEVEEYIAACKAQDIPAVEAFWSNSDEFVFAGDGTILGGSDEWNAQIDSWAADVDHYLYWNNDNMHVAVLGRNAASYTTELQTAYVRTSGDTLRMKGSWTYVFKRFGDDWQVIHGNGTHLFE